MPDDPRAGPWDPFDELSHEVGLLFQALDPLGGRRGVRAYPPLNLYDAGDRFVLAAELPGHVASAIELTLAGDVLTLSGERRPADRVDSERYRRRERGFGRWSRTLAMPARVNAEGVSARYAMGILTVELPKSPEPSARQITVNDGTS